MKKILFLLGMLFVFNAQSQIIIDNTAPYNSTTFLIDSVLLGGGVTATNHSFQGNPLQIGWFDGSNSNVGIDTGIVLSSGNISDLVGPNSSGSTSTDMGALLTPPIFGGAAGDPTLDAIITPDSTRDAAVLEFDFIPNSDTISFKYVFGSEEYLEFVNQFNDAFGFFLSGPNPAGGNYVNQNLAIVPGTVNTPVTINNVNDIVNPAYYIDNGDGFTSPQNTDPTVIQFDGFTTPLTAVASVNCGDTYHIKLVVADVNDGSWDSGVFLEAGSFLSPELSVVDNLGIDSTFLAIDCGQEVILTADGGPSALYEWYDYNTGFLVETGPSITIINDGAYYVIASDVSGCSTISDTFNIVASSFGLKDFTVSHTDVSCWDDTDGNIAISIDDYINVLSYNFFLDGNLNTNSHPQDTLFNNVSAGDHLIEIVDSLYLCDTSFIVSISAPGYPLQALVASSEVIVCYGSIDGEVVGSAAGGTPGYSYEWFDSGFTSFSTNDTAFGLVAGSYYLEVTDANGCDTFTSVNIIEPQIPLQGSPQLFNVACKGDSTGMIVGDASGSWAPYRYYWLDINGDTLQSSIGYITTRDTLFNLVADIYVLHIYDAKDCFVDYTLNIFEPDFPLSIDSLKVVESIACYGDSVGKAIMYISGGDPNYYCLWDNGETGVIASTLTSGYHTVSLTDDLGCKVVDSVEILENPLIESELVVNTTVSCYGLSDGIAFISSIGGASSTYTYFWSQGQQTSGVSSDIADSLLHGSYYATTRDSLGCEVVDSVYISEPEPLSMEASELDWVDCYNESTGEAFATATGGTVPYLFEWTVNGLWGDTVSTLPPGLHTVVVTDAKGCTSSDTVFLHNPDSLYINIDDSLTILPYCMGVNSASLSALAEGGTKEYTYEWDDNSTLPQTTTTATNLLAGTYTITVTDSKGCTASDTRDINTITNSMDAQAVSLIQYIGGNDISCFGEDDGQALVSAWGAHAPYSYQWYGPNNFSSTNDTITNLLAGVYSVTVKDTNDCKVNSSINLIEPLPIKFDLSFINEPYCLMSCNGSIKIDTLSGGSSGNYIALLTDNITGVTTSHPINSASFIVNVCPGDYTVNITDENGCISSVISGGNNQVLVGTFYAQVPPPVIAVTNEVSCYGGSDGAVSLVGSSSNYIYTWYDDNGNSLGNGDTVNNLEAGNYHLILYYGLTFNIAIQDSSCASPSLPVTITAPDLIQISATIINATCSGDNNGSIDASIVGGTLGASNAYNLLWSTAATTEDLSNLIAGSYTLSATDDNNCHESVTFQVTEPQALSCSVTQDQPNGYVLTANPNGGAAPYSYSWREQSSPNNSIGTGTTYIVTNYGTYYALVTDANNCIVETNSFEYKDVTSTGNELTNVDLSIYPNPFRDETTVDFGRDITQATISLVDMFGKKIEEYNITNTSKHIITRNNKASGIYFVEIQVGERERVIFKLIIE